MSESHVLREDSYLGKCQNTYPNCRQKSTPGDLVNKQDQPTLQQANYTHQIFNNKKDESQKLLITQSTTKYINGQLRAELIEIHERQAPRQSIPMSALAQYQAFPMIDNIRAQQKLSIAESKQKIQQKQIVLKRQEQLIRLVQPTLGGVSSLEPTSLGKSYGQDHVLLSQQGLVHWVSYGRVVIIQHQDYSSTNRELEILSKKELTNTKFLIAQGNQLLSYLKWLLIQEQTKQLTKKQSQFNVQVRRLKIAMRNHQYTIQINFTSPINKHNGEINVKMPQQVKDNQMQRYLLLKEKLQSAKNIQNDLDDRQQKLCQYQNALLRKFQLKGLGKQVVQTYGLVVQTRNNVELSTRLIQSRSQQQLSPRNSNYASSVHILGPKTNMKTSLKAQFSSKSPLYTSKNNNFQKFNVLKLKKSMIQQSLTQKRTLFQNKTIRLIDEISLLRKQIQLVDDNLKLIEQNKNNLISKIQHAKNKKKLQKQVQDQNNVEKLYVDLINQRKRQYQKEKQSRDINDKGFTMFLRSNKSLSPFSNNILLSARKIQTNHSPRYKDFTDRKNSQKDFMGRNKQYIQKLQKLRKQAKKGPIQ